MPASYFEVVEWLCQQLEIEMPPSLPAAEVHFTLGANRQIDAITHTQMIGAFYREY